MMRIKNLYQCNENCKKCNYVNKHPTGYSVMDECETDICPMKNEKLGNIDKLGGRHMDGYGWNPLGEFCNLCKHETCEGCVKWSNRDKKLRNNIPPALKQEQPKKTQPKPTTQTQQPLAQENKPTPPPITTKTTTVSESTEKTLPEVIKTTANDMQQSLEHKSSIHTFVDRESVVDSDISDFDLDDFGTSVDKENMKEIFNQNTESVDDDNFDEIDFGFESEDIGDNSDDYQDIDFDDDDIPSPYDDETENMDEDTDEDVNEEMSDFESKIFIDDENEDYDEDDDAIFEMYEPTSKLKASILFSAGTKIAKYQVRAKGILLTVAGDAKVTVKGSNDSEGFSYCDPNRFPQYVRKGIMNGELYKNPNMLIVDNSYFAIVYYHDTGDELITKEQIVCKQDISEADEDAIRRMLARAYDAFVNK